MVIPEIEFREIQRLLRGDPEYRSAEFTGEQFILASEGSYVLLVAGEDVSPMSSTLGLVRRQVDDEIPN